MNGSSEPRDGWTKIDIGAKTIGAVFIPAALLVLARDYRQQDIQRGNEVFRVQISQQNADRATNLLGHLVSDKPYERKLAVRMAEYLDQNQQLPQGSWEFIRNIIEFDPDSGVKAVAVQVTRARVAAQVAATPVKVDAPTNTVASPVQTDRTRADPERRVDIAAATDDVVTLNIVPTFARTRVLWVDDRPENNRFLGEALRTLGMTVDTVLNTASALTAVQRTQYDLIISDLGRGTERQAGFTLLTNLRQRGDSIPFIVYTGQVSNANHAEALQRGAVGLTNIPETLLRLVNEVLLKRRNRPT